MRKAIVITSINQPTDAVLKFSQWNDWQLIVVGDNKTPLNWKTENVIYLDIEKQKDLFPELFDLIPFNSYKRKVFGYLHAIQNGAEFIFDTDDDNLPYDFAENVLNSDINLIGTIPSRLLTSTNNWTNIYSHFDATKIWPRGFPIEFINQNENVKYEHNDNVKIGVIQYLADIDPDVDAIFRLVENRMQNFAIDKKINLSKNLFSPFNSQATIWKKEFFHLMFFPLGVSDRVTDIIRGYFALASLWFYNNTIQFSSPIVYQERNAHNLLSDFNLEIPLYQNATKWCNSTLEVIHALEKDVNPYFKILEKFVQDGIINHENLRAYSIYAKYIYQRRLNVCNI